MSVPFLPSDFTWLHAFAVGLIFALWSFYTQILGIIGKGSLNTQLHAVRLRWLHMHQSVARDQRVIDALMLGHISSSISYFGSATLIILAALVGTLVNINRVYIVTRELAFLAPMSADLFALNFALVALVLVLSLFALPGFLLIALAAFFEGLVARDIRRYTGGHESSYIFHKAKRWVIPSVVLTVTLYLMVPFSLPPAVVFAPTMLLAGVMVYVATSRFKKFV